MKRRNETKQMTAPDRTAQTRPLFVNTLKGSKQVVYELQRRQDRQTYRQKGMNGSLNNNR